MTDEIYKYEIRSKSGEVFMKSDPYAFTAEVRPANASRVTSLDYIWHDKKWIEKRDFVEKKAEDAAEAAAEDARVKKTSENRINTLLVTTAEVLASPTSTEPPSTVYPQ